MNMFIYVAFRCNKMIQGLKNTTMLSIYDYDLDIDTIGNSESLD